MRNPFANTIEERILSATPIELTAMLYDGLVSSIEQARLRLKSGDIHGRAREISRAEGIVAELAGSLNPDADRAMTERLSAIYVYMLGLLHEANAHQLEAPLMETGRLASTLREAWESINGNMTGNMPAHMVADEPVAALSGLRG